MRNKFMTPDDPRHGTVNGYSNLDCRCERCCAANTENQRQKREDLKGRLEPGDPRHGSLNGYSNYGCRCDKCSAVHNANCLDRYYKKKRKVGSASQLRTPSNR